MTTEPNAALPEAVLAAADEAYFKTYEKGESLGWNDPATRSSILKFSRHAAYAEVWRAARQPLPDVAPLHLCPICGRGTLTRIGLQAHLSVDHTWWQRFKHRARAEEN